MEEETGVELENLTVEEGDLTVEEEDLAVEEEAMKHEVPSLAEIMEGGAPAEYIPLLVVNFLLVLFVMVLLVRAVNEHRRFVTKYTMQGLCTLGIILVIPIFSVMYYSGVIVPKAMAKVTFIAETYEAISLLFFLRLILTFMGGKNETRVQLKGQKVALTSPPLCCLVCLPHVKFSKKFLFIHEMFVIQLAVLQLVLGYIDLLIGLDESHKYPAALLEETYSHYFHIFILFSLVLAVYGLGGIYHSAEHQLQHYRIFEKFILYKAFVTVVKVEELLVTMVAENISVELGVGAIPTHLRVHLWLYTLVLLQSAVVFPFLLRAYSVQDYQIPIVKQKKQDKKEEDEEEKEGEVVEMTQYVSFPDAAQLECSSADEKQTDV